MRNKNEEALAQKAGKSAIIGMKIKSVFLSLVVSLSLLTYSVF